MKFREIRLIVTALLLISSLCTFAGRVMTKADKLNAKVDAELKILSSQKDSAGYYFCVANAILFAVECDKADSLLSYHASNQSRLEPLRRRMIHSALSSPSYSPEQLKRFFNVFIESASSPLFSNVTYPAGKVALMVSQKAMSLAQYAMAEYYADIALLYADYAAKAAEMKVGCMRHRLRTQADSTAYLMVLLDLHERQPDNKTYYSQLLDVLTEPGRETDLVKFADDELRRDSADVRAWILKGEASMHMHHWDNAIAAYKKAEEIEHPLGVDYNLGICLSSKALELKDSLVDSRGRLSKTDRPKVRKLLDEACVFMERVRQGDAGQKQFKWAKPLYLIYDATGQRGRAKEIKELMED